MHTSYLSRSMRMGVQRAGDVDSTSSIARGDVHAAGDQSFAVHFRRKKPLKRINSERFMG